MADPREDAAKERAAEQEMDREREELGLTHIAHLTKDWKEKKAKRERDKEEKDST